MIITKSKADELIKEGKAALGELFFDRYSKTWDRKVIRYDKNGSWFYVEAVETNG